MDQHWLWMQRYWYINNHNCLTCEERSQLQRYQYTNNLLLLVPTPVIIKNRQTYQRNVAKNDE